MSFQICSMRKSGEEKKCTMITFQTTELVCSVLVKRRSEMFFYMYEKRHTSCICHCVFLLPFSRVFQRRDFSHEYYIKYVFLLYVQLKVTGFIASISFPIFWEQSTQLFIRNRFVLARTAPTTAPTIHKLFNAHCRKKHK